MLESRLQPALHQDSLKAGLQLLATNAESRMHDYDKSSKWLIQHHGDSILRLAGINDIVSWRKSATSD